MRIKYSKSIPQGDKTALWGIRSNYLWFAIYMKAIDNDIGIVKGIGPKKAKLLEKLHIRTLRDALETYPREYEDRTHITPINEITEEGRYAIRAVVGTAPVLSRIKGGLTLVKFRIFDETGIIGVTFFNAPYAASQFHVGREYLFYGPVHTSSPGYPLSLVSPQADRIPKDSEHIGRIVPVYPLTSGLTQKDMAKVTDAALNVLGDELPDPLLESLRVKYCLPSSVEAVRQIHRPQSINEVTEARRRMVFEELFLLCCGLRQMRERRKQDNAPVLAQDGLNRFFAALPFKPTNAQSRAIKEIARDVVSGHPMNRLVQGDVGSGKTVVAAAACALAGMNGYQAAFMAPTEILASQHINTISPMLEKLGLSCVLLTGSMTALQKREALFLISSGEADVVVGTHALIQKNVEFKRLGVAVADEQHRFGVAQRAALTAKGDAPHMLVMSATPIPRTLALIMYGDLDVSVLDELPPGRKPVATYAVGEPMRKRIYAFIEKQIKAGGQAYVVCPLVEEGINVTLKSAERHAEDIRRALPDRRIAVLHGKMKNTEKESIMRDFAEKKYDVLVATTVIEVGVDVPNANLMIVEDADRFGLSQLHQLRGRVGRGERESYCIFFGADKGETARERLKTLCKTNDGFEVAKADLEQRGPGDFFGRRQHGLPALRFAGAATDLQLMQSARDEAEMILEKDPKLEGFPELRERVDRMFDERNEEAFN